MKKIIFLFSFYCLFVLGMKAQGSCGNFSVSIYSQVWNDICVLDATLYADVFGSAGNSYTYMWYENGVYVGSSPSLSITGGEYSVTVTDEYGCSANDNIFLYPIYPECGDPAFSYVINGNTVQLNPYGLNQSWGVDDWSIKDANGNIVATYPQGTTSIVFPTGGTYTIHHSVYYYCASWNECDYQEQTISIAGCTSLQTVITGTTTLCAGGTLSLTASGANSYSWIFPDNSTSSNNVINISNVSTLQSGIYTVVGTDANGCTATASTQVNIINPPLTTISANGPTSFCASANINVPLSTNTISGASYQWRKDGIDIVGANAAAYSASQVGDYDLITSTNNTCISTSNSITINTFTGSADAGRDTVICYGGTAVTIGTPAIVGCTYSWYPTTGLSGTTPVVSNPTPHANPSSTTTYTLYVTNSAGCISSDAITVTKNPQIVVNAGADQNVCSGNTTKTLTGTVSGGTPPYNYSWYSANNGAGTISNPTSFSTNVTPISSSTYTFKLTDNKGCYKTDAVAIFVRPLPNITAGTDKNYCQGSNPVQIGGVNNNVNHTYSWQPSSGLNNPSSPTPLASPSVTTTYTLTATSQYGCVKTANVTVNGQSVPGQATVSTSSVSICAKSGQNITLSYISQGATYQKWYRRVQGVSAYTYVGNTINHIVSQNLVPNVYEYIVRTYTNSTNTCYAESNPIVISVLEAPIPTINTGTATIVNNTTVSICNTVPSIAFNGSVSGTPPQTWSWDYGTNNSNYGTNPISTSNTVIATNAGYYRITANYVNGCKQTAYKRLMKVACTNIRQSSPKGNESTEENDVEIETVLPISFNAFPNPTSDEITISFQNWDIDEGKITIINTLGQIILEKDIIIDTNNAQFIADLTHEANGIYLVVFTSNNPSKEVQSFKIVKE